MTGDSNEVQPQGQLADVQFPPQAVNPKHNPDIEEFCHILARVITRLGAGLELVPAAEGEAA